ncbi:hypothetical protein [Helicobacter cappadocius]|uniref:Periplasmic protein n=1 Tax=Helicobacter cappadocius TaxID=3063998 RepID=A0AA90PM76_9HELI|nr:MULTISPECIES: hypothetical protein [unclassified Helicobacter]MDO7253835.1 hypothetical protein [Helicobacter sp. faydin-H75]MDP2539724.1 hypothetical protein [Helicobacter sp. faydin-H76]
MKKIFFLFLFFLSPLFSQWQMFSDKTDTYLYNTITGEVYIRYKKNGKNYEDVFVKMPKGVIPQGSEFAPEISVETPSSSQKKDSKMEAIKKAQDIMNQSIGE